MNDDVLDDIPAAGTTGTRHALLIAALLHLMSQYTLRSADQAAQATRRAARGARATQAEDAGPCVKLAAVIERHLDALARLPDADPVLRATCEQLRTDWADLVDSRMPPPAPRRALLARILRPVPSKPAEPVFAG